MTDPVLKSVECCTGSPVSGSVIWLHGLGADGHDFESIVPQLRLPSVPLRYVFPHAPVRPVTINNGITMPAWFDLIGIDRRSPQDEAGIRKADLQVQQLIRRENERGIPSDSIVLAGFSQGAALALHDRVGRDAPFVLAPNEVATLPVALATAVHCIKGIGTRSC